MKVQDLLTNPSRWIQGAYEIDGSYCLAGAVEACYRGAARKVIFDRIRMALGQGGITDWNDNIHRSFSEVRKLIVSLDI